MCWSLRTLNLGPVIQKFVYGVLLQLLGTDLFYLNKVKTNYISIKQTYSVFPRYFLSISSVILQYFLNSSSGVSQYQNMGQLLRDWYLSHP